MTDVLTTGHGTWAQFAPRYEHLRTTPLDAGNAAGWLYDWSELEKDVFEAHAQLSRAKDADPSNSDAEHAYLKFIQDVQGPASTASHALTERLLAVRDWQPAPEHRQLLRRMRADAEIFRQENVALQTEISTLANEYNKITGALRAEVNGEQLSIPRAQRLLTSPDRALREAAWRAVAAAQLQAAPQLDELFLKLLALRRQVARNADCANYRDYAWRDKQRFDYTPEDTRVLHAAVADVVAPLLRRVNADRQRKLNLDTVRPWDTAADPDGLPGLEPFTSTEEYLDVAGRILDTLDPELGGQFRAMHDGGYLDVDPRPDKVPGYGYCNYLPRTGSPYIYWSAVGTDGDVRVLMHEAGHAFHFNASGDGLSFNLMSPIEFAEVGSQAMELLTLPLLERPVGYYDARDAARARRDKLDTVLRQFTSQSAADAFQQWLYSEAPDDVTIRQIDEKWLECTRRFDTGVDWSGLEREQAKGWQFVHVFAYPLYMLEYSLAWLGALQVWRNAQQDAPRALEQYKQALALGNTRPLPELFEVAGARFAFDAGTVRELMDMVERERFGAA